jgi:hypothetical protein
VFFLFPGQWIEGGVAGLATTTVELLLALGAFIIGYVAAAKLARRSDWEFDGADDAPPAASSQATISPSAERPGLDARLERIETALATLPAQTTKAIKACPSADLDRTLRSIQRALRKPHGDPVLIEAVQSLQADGLTGLTSRIEALETRIGERLAAIDARLAMLNLHEPTALPALPPLPTRRPNGLAPKRISHAVAEIKRSIDSLPH